MPSSQSEFICVAGCERAFHTQAHYAWHYRTCPVRLSKTSKATAGLRSKTFELASEPGSSRNISAQKSFGWLREGGRKLFRKRQRKDDDISASGSHSSGHTHDIPLGQSLRASRNLPYDSHDFTSVSPPPTSSLIPSSPMAASDIDIYLPPFDTKIEFPELSEKRQRRPTAKIIAAQEDVLPEGPGHLKDESNEMPESHEPVQCILLHVSEHVHTAANAFGLLPYPVPATKTHGSTVASGRAGGFRAMGEEHQSSSTTPSTLFVDIHHAYMSSAHPSRYAISAVHANFAAVIIELFTGGPSSIFDVHAVTRRESLLHGVGIRYDGIRTVDLVLAAQPLLPTFLEARSEADGIGLNLKGVQSDTLRKSYSSFLVFKTRPTSSKLASDIHSLITTTTWISNVTTQPLPTVNLAFSHSGLTAMGIIDNPGDPFHTGGQEVDSVRPSVILELEIG
ncbi:hypothetical protein IW261DRAFT_1672024 [Armillaria novae-zelandiae]|uniref:DyP dimeric alpha+beta barrel domain-containing protein n=1 Tax=Armillaria novae-zelandiae TaxID=153914 RepID=A0AA39NS99_9AGAR|nr:hypothetical protein IW261DRAFT_1672024 [Armillaria novae-zelandiae]